MPLLGLAVGAALPFAMRHGGVASWAPLGQGRRADGGSYPESIAWWKICHVLSQEQVGITAVTLLA
jgi:hypothetical protein